MNAKAEEAYAALVSLYGVKTADYLLGEFGEAWYIPYGDSHPSVRLTPRKSELNEVVTDGR